MFNLGRVGHVLVVGMLVPSQRWLITRGQAALPRFAPPTLLALPTVLEAKNINFTIHIATIDVCQT